MANQERLDRMRRAMETEHLDALVLRLPENVLLLSGFWPMIGATTLVFPREGRATAIIPQCSDEETRASLQDADILEFRFGVLNSPDARKEVARLIAQTALGRGWKRVGYEAEFGAIAPSWQSGEVLVPTASAKAYYSEAIAGADLVDASALIRAERSTKTEWEAERLRIVGEISCLGLAAFQQGVDVGRTGVELVALVEHEIMTKGTGYRGVQRVRAYAQVATGVKETAVSYRMHEIYSRRPMASGDIAVLELGVVADGYWADRTRVRVAGKTTDEQQKIFDVLCRAQEAACAAVRPGVTGADVDETARSIIRDAGYADGFNHITGHGLGFGYHESSPILAPGVEARLEAGMVTSVEPGIYFEPFGGFRIEDDVLVTATGFEVLGPFRKSLAA